MTLATNGAKAPAASLFGPQHDVPESVDPLLVTILAWPRPHESYAEKKFRAWLAAQIKALSPESSVEYRGDNLYVPARNGEKTLFSCHIDTVDAQIEGSPILNGKEKDTHKAKSLTYDKNFGIVALDKASKHGTCLGADDGVGVWLMLKMLAAGIGGGYIFHVGEERGGLGSLAMVAQHTPELAKYKAAVAFDRPRCNEVITHQRGSECASQTYGKALAEELNKCGFQFATSDRGVFTDTANYRRIIPECLNLGVGYTDQHSTKEVLDYSHANALAGALCSFDWETMPIVRDCTKPDYVAPAKWRGRDELFGEPWGAYQRKRDDDLGLDDIPWSKYERPITPKAKKPAAAYVSPPKYEPMPDIMTDAMTMTGDDITHMIDNDPEIACDMMMDLTVEVARLRAEVMVWRQLAGRGTV